MARLQLPKWQHTALKKRRRTWGPAIIFYLIHWEANELLPINIMKRFPNNKAVYASKTQTRSFSSLEKAIGMITPPFCIIFHAEADFNVKTVANAVQPPEKAPAA